MLRVSRVNLSVNIMSDEWLNTIKWDPQGLLPAIAQDSETGRVLMFAWMNRESLRLTVEEGRAVYWSRSRNQLWRKGEESGNVQELKAIELDCDADVVLLHVKQLGNIACHTGRNSCFYRRLNNANEWVTVEDVLKSPEDMYKR